MTKARFDSALQCKHPIRVTKIIAYIDEVGALDTETETAIFNHRRKDVLHLEIIIEKLERQELLTSEYKSSS